MVAAGTSRGGRITSETAIASLDPMSKTTTIVWPMTLDCASTWPSSGQPPAI